MTHRLQFSEKVFQQVCDQLSEPVEVAAVLTCSIVRNAGGVTIAVRDVSFVDDEHYRIQRVDQLAISSPGWVPAVRAAGAAGSAAGFLHTHPQGSAMFSAADDIVDHELAQPFCDLSGQSHYVSVIFAGTSGHPKVTARVWSPDSGWEPVTRITAAGDRLRFISQIATSNEPRADRQIRALSRRGNDAVAGLHVGLVGAGGAGSPIAEQMLRLGVAELTPIDTDVVTETTLSRGSGFGVSHLNQPKVDAVAWLAEHIGSRTKVNPIQGDITDAPVVARLAECDVVFGATDNHASRIVLNRFAYNTHTPVIDCGVLVSAKPASVEVFNRITWLGPGNPCLLCLRRIDPVRAAAEQLGTEEAERLAAEGYVPDLAEPDPAVVTFATSTAALAASTMVMRIVEIGNVEANEVVLNLGEPRLIAARRKSRPGCFCNQPPVTAAPDRPSAA